MNPLPGQIRMIDPQDTGPGASDGHAPYGAAPPPQKAAARRSVPLTPEEERICDMATD